MVALHATYWFTDGCYEDINEIRKAVESTFTKIQDEVYEIKNVYWPVVNETVAV